jgi:hypothetical protein
MNKFNKGTTVKIKDNVSSKGEYYKYKGKIGIITEVNYYNNTVNIKIDQKIYDDILLSNVGYSVIEVYNKSKNMTNKQTLTEILEKKKEEIFDIEDKLKFLNETNQDTFNENEYKAYQTLSLIEEGNLSKGEKAKKIAELLK